MLSIQNQIDEIIGKIPLKYQSSILEYAKLMKEKADKGEQSDTDYLNSIPGIADSIIKEAKIDLGNYSEELDW
ncbi:MAG: hypothetical protein HND40_10815 [Ignavibacteriota bacterium]|jgi:hypothetical protein|nr:MAG: hypothetical protein F9K42_01570 [Ignavibacterium sp.]MBL1155237.1 hypothetical protein [Ignavibacteriota bacterium]MCO6449028.1 hypothetical protein [Ignavibacterium album]MCZ2269102.1 hypothetical protein [Ignavibacteriales bacterium]MDX9711305.1 hypothetical protein [Ignavibacteriaceae bacterium]